MCLVQYIGECHIGDGVYLGLEVVDGKGNAMFDVFLSLML